jgi:hypothetical protein
MEDCQIEMPYDGVDIMYNHLLPLPPPARGLIFARAKMKGESFSSVKILQKYVGAKPTGLANPNTCVLVQDVLRSKGSIRFQHELVDLLLEGETEEPLIKNLQQYKFTTTKG